MKSAAAPLDSGSICGASSDRVRVGGPCQERVQMDPGAGRAMEHSGNSSTPALGAGPGPEGTITAALSSVFRILPLN